MSTKQSDGARGDLELYIKALLIAKIHFQRQLLDSPEAQAYVKERDLNSATLHAFDIGYTRGGRSLANHYSTATMAEAALSAELLRKGDRGVYDFFRDRVMFPVHDLDGRIMGFGGRAMPGGDANFKYVNMPEGPYYHKGSMLYGAHQAREETAKTGDLIVVEGYIDVLRLYQSGIRCSVAPLGTAFTPAQMDLAKTMGARTLYFCFDGDRAGQSAAEKAALVALAGATPWMQIKFMDLDNQDPDDFIRERGREAFEQRKADAIDVCQFLSKRMWQPLNPQRISLEDRSGYITRMQPYVEAAKGSLRNELLREIEYWGDLPLQSLNIGGKPASSLLQRSGYIAPDDVLLARVLAAGQVPDEAMDAMSRLYPTVVSEASNEKSVLGGLARSLGPVSDDELEQALAALEESGVKSQLAAALKAARDMPFDAGLVQEVKGHLMLAT